MARWRHEGFNICLPCKGTGSDYSGVEHMGIRELVSCDECMGTGFIDPKLEIDRLNAVIAKARKVLDGVTP